MKANRLQLNTSKTEVLWCSSGRRQHQIPRESVEVDQVMVAPVNHARDLGIFMDSDVSMSTHITNTVSSCFAMLRQIRSIRRSVIRPVLQSLVVSLVLSRLDYGNATLVGMPDRLTDRLQSVLHAGARLIHSARKFEHVTPLLQDLHWLSIRERIDYKLAVLVFRCLHGLAPSYLSNGLQRIAEVDSRRRLRSAQTAQLVIPRTRCSTLGDRSFPVAAARVWNSLPTSLSTSVTLSSFKIDLKSYLFARSYLV